ncbi:hypothetical protein JS82_06725 [Methanomassiliicoccaceae archaeon DOK]|nr:hypothetical protein JS82_06725 [Methanomassiliicoccaceae archaeon DOK]
MNEKGRQTKLLAAIAVLAMVVCAFAMVVPSDVNGEVTDDGTTATITEAGDFKKVLGIESDYTTIKLGKDIAADVTIPANKKVTLDLNGYKLTNNTSHTITVEASAELTIVDSSDDKTGTIDNVTHAKAAIYNSGKVTLNGGTIERSLENGAIVWNDETKNYDDDKAKSTNTFYTIQNLGTLDINNGAVVKNNGDMSSVIVNGQSSTTAGIMNVYGGKIIGGKYVKNESGTMTISGGEFTDGRCAAIASYGTLKITGGNFDNGTRGSLYILGGSLEITGGSFSSTKSDDVHADVTYKGTVFAWANSISKIAISGMTQYNPNSVLFIEETSIVGDLSVDLNGSILKTSNIKAGEDGIIISQGSVVISGDIDGAATITATGEVKLNGVDITNKLTVGTVNGDENKVIIQNLTIGTGGSLEIQSGAFVEVPEDGTLTNNSSISISNAGTLALYNAIQGNKTDVTNTGTLAVAPGVEQPKTTGEGGTIVSTTAIGESLGLNQNLDTDLTIKSSAFLEKNLTIQAGVTLTIGANATLDLNGCELIVNGSIVIMNNGSIVNGGNNTGAIVLSKSGSIENNGGVIGKGDAINIKLTASESVNARDQYNTGYISVQDVSGIGIVIDKKVDGQKVYYTLALTGDISKKGNVAGTVTVKNTTTGDKVYVDGTLEVGNGTTLKVDTSATLELKKSATLDVASKGAVNGVGAIVLNDSATVNMDGSVTGVFQAPTGKYLTNGMDKATYTTQVSVTNVTGLVITATSVTAYDADEENTVTEVRLVLSGSVEQGSFTIGNGDKATDAEVEISASGTPNDDVDSYAGVYVEDTLFIDEKVKTFELNNNVQTVITVLGTVTYENAYTPSATNTIGVQYTVESEDADGKKTTTNYVKPFATAFADIAKADDMTLNVYGPVEIASEITVGADQTVSGGDFTITVDGKITVAESGIMNVTSMDVQGILVVTADGSFAHTGKFNYSTMTENEETGDVTYAGFAVALANAKPGDIIEISKETKVSASFTIPAEVTVRVTADGSIVPAEDKTVNMTVNGTLENEGTIQINGNTTVNGVVDLTEGGSATLCGTPDKVVNVTGEVIANSTIADKINAVWYTNDDGQVVYTTLAKAVTAISAMDVPVEITQVGNVSDSAAVELGDITLNVTGTAVFGDIALEKGTVKVTGNGVLTATITGPVGDEGSTVDSAVQLSKVSNATVTSGSTPNSQNVQVWYLNFDTTASDDTIDGAVTVSAGTVQIIGTTVVDGKDNTLTVANGATAVIPAGQDNVLTAGDNDDGKAVVTVAGTMTVNGTLNVTGIMDVTGTLTVATSEGAEAAVVNVDDGVNNDADNNATLNILGTLTVVENEDENKAVVNVSGILVIGDKPTVLGAGGVLAGPVDTIDAGYVKAYAGADLTGAKIDWNNQSAESEAESSVFYINGYEYMAVYTSVTVTFQNVLDDEVFQLTGYEMVVPGANAADDVYNINNAKFWNADADLTEPLDSAIGSSDAYTKANASVVPVTVSVGTGISLYIDGIKYESGSTPNLAVGTHTITATVDPGYTGTVTVQFNGQAVTGSFTITPEMASAAYEGTVSVSATGSIAVDGGSSSGSASSDDGMGLTDYLLIILVILIVVMAIIVAMRLMRS